MEQLSNLKINRRAIINIAPSPETYLPGQLKSVLNGMPIAVSWADLTDQKIHYLNQKFTEMFGYELGDHKTVREWIENTYSNPQHAQLALSVWEPYFGTDSSIPVELNQREVDILCKDGSTKTCLMGGMLLPQEKWALATFTDISERKRYEEKIKKMALEDDLTKLANRRSFKKILRTTLAHSQRHHSHSALLLIDIDDFKQINDTLGHDNGDIALKAVADNIIDGVREEDFASRLGGDEFAVVLSSIEGSDVAEEVADRILQGMAKPIVLDGHETSLSVSIGIGLYPESGPNGMDLIKAADEALYRAKEKGKGSWSS